MGWWVHRKQGNWDRQHTHSSGRFDYEGSQICLQKEDWGETWVDFKDVRKNLWRGSHLIGAHKQTLQNKNSLSRLVTQGGKSDFGWNYMGLSGSAEPLTPTGVKGMFLLYCYCFSLLFHVYTQIHTNSYTHTHTHIVNVSFSLCIDKYSIY